MWKMFSLCCASPKRAKVPVLFYIISSAFHVSTVANMHLVSLSISTASCVDVFNIPAFRTATLYWGPVLNGAPYVSMFYSVFIKRQVRDISWLSTPWGIRTNRIKIIGMQLIKMVFADFFLFFSIFFFLISELFRAAPSRIMACVF